MYTRISKLVLVWAAALFASLVAFNNLTDYDSNYLFVSHVLRMDTTFAGNRGMWRAIDSAPLYHVLYWLIIASEVAVAALCWAGGWCLLQACKEAERFNRAKGLAIAGLTSGILLWFTGFISVGGEWFLMWQSKEWNGEEAAFRIVAILGIVLLYLTRNDSQQDA